MLVDTRGLSCPQPVVEIKNALAKGVDEIEALIDNATSLANVTRFMNKQGFTAKNSFVESDGSTRVVFSK